MNYSFLDRFIGEGRGSPKNCACAGKEVSKNDAYGTRNSDIHTFGRLKKL